MGSGVARLSSLGGFGLSRLAAILREHGSRERPSTNGEVVSVGGFDDEAGGGHGGEALVEGWVVRTRQDARSSENGFGCSPSARAVVMR